MMIIDRCPRSLRVFFYAFLSALSEAQYHHLWTMVLAIALNPAGSKLIRVAVPARREWPSSHVRGVVPAAWRLGR